MSTSTIPQKSLSQESENKTEIFIQHLVKLNKNDFYYFQLLLQIDDLVKDCCISIADSGEIPQSCNEPLKYLSPYYNGGSTILGLQS